MDPVRSGVGGPGVSVFGLPVLKRFSLLACHRNYSAVFPLKSRTCDL